MYWQRYLSPGVDIRIARVSRGNAPERKTTTATTKEGSRHGLRRMWVNFNPDRSRNDSMIRDHHLVI